MKQAPGLPMSSGDERLAKVDPHAMDIMKQPEGQKLVGDIRSTVRESMTADYIKVLQSLLSGKNSVEGKSDRGQVSIAKLADGSIAVISNNGVAVEEFVVQNGALPLGIRYSPAQGADGEGTTVSAEGLDRIIQSFSAGQGKLSA